MVLHPTFFVRAGMVSMAPNTVLLGLPIEKYIVLHEDKILSSIRGDKIAERVSFPLRMNILHFGS